LLVGPFSSPFLPLLSSVAKVCEIFPPVFAKSPPAFPPLPFPFYLTGEDPYNPRTTVGFYHTLPNTSRFFPCPFPSFLLRDTHEEYPWFSPPSSAAWQPRPAPFPPPSEGKDPPSDKRCRAFRLCWPNHDLFFFSSPLSSPGQQLQAMSMSPRVTGRERPNAVEVSEKATCAKSKLKFYAPTSLV